MKIRKLIIFCALSASLCSWAGVEVEGSRFVSVEAPATSGLSEVLVVEDTYAASLVFTAASASTPVRWYSFGSAGGGYAEPIENVVYQGATSKVSLSAEDKGFLIEENGRQKAVWVVDYALHYPTMTGMFITPENDCDRVMFETNGGFDRILYYSINGAPLELNRGIRLEYTDLKDVTSGSQEDGDYDASWQQVTKYVEFPYISGTFSAQAPLCNTDFVLTGDRFLEMWGGMLSFSTETYLTTRVDAITWAVQESRENENEQNPSTTGLGGSAPCIITFNAVPTDAAVFTEWQFSPTEDFSDVLYRFNDSVFTFTFTEYGTTYVRFECADASGQCMYDSDIYTVMVGESKLLCPNAFSPHNQDGVNDEWRVSYSSLVSFDCHIFNRWGKELFSTTNPAQGWDGKVGGKFVPSGVYFYVIKAEGADGRQYNLSGDINIIGSKLRPTTEGGEEIL